MLVPLTKGRRVLSRFLIALADSWHSVDYSRTFDLCMVKHFIQQSALEVVCVAFSVFGF
jgi:hypothetical protein